MRWILAGLLAVAGGQVPAQTSGQPLTGSVAKAELFPAEDIRVEMLPVPPLKPEELKLIGQVAAGYPYYAAVAVAPSEELLKSEATSLAGNYHSPQAAAAAALAECNAKRKGGRSCEIAAYVKPKAWQDRPFMLSKEATTAMDEDYGRRGPRALAVSLASGAWAVGKGKGAGEAALAACAGKGAGDCVVVVQD